MNHFSFFKSLHLSCYSRSEEFFYIGNFSAALKELISNAKQLPAHPRDVVPLLPALEISPVHSASCGHFPDFSVLIKSVSLPRQGQSFALKTLRQGKPKSCSSGPNGCLVCWRAFR